MEWRVHGWDLDELNFAHVQLIGIQLQSEVQDGRWRTGSWEELDQTLLLGMLWTIFMSARNINSGWLQNQY